MIGTNRVVQGTLVDTDEITIDCNGIATVIAAIAGSWTGGLQFNVSYDGTTWSAMSGVSLTALDGQIPTEAQEPGVFAFPVAGAQLFKLTSTFLGSADVTLSGSPESIVTAAIQAYTFVKNSGDFDIQNITGTVSLPTGAATAANQSTANSSLSSIDSKTLAVMASQVDEASSTVTYVGKAAAGTATSAASWQIFKMSVSGTVTSVTFADGNINFDNVWDNRASLSYS